MSYFEFMNSSGLFNYMGLVYSWLMRIVLFVLLLTILLPCGARDVYRSVSEDGIVIYSDTYRPGAERVSVSDQGHAAVKQQAAQDTPREAYQTESNAQYQIFAIEQPENDETIRSNEGNVSVGLALSPSLAAGHVIQVFLDNAQLGSDLTTTQFSLTSLNRGTHSLQAKIIDAEGAELMATDPISFHLRKASIKRP